MDTFMNALIKMSLRGTVIILIVLCVRLLLKKLRVSHKYIIGLWAMVFLYFIIPWKISLPVGFWNNAIVPEEVRVVIEDLSAGYMVGAADNAVNALGNPGAADDMADAVGIPGTTDGTVNDGGIPAVADSKVNIAGNLGTVDDAAIGMPGNLTDDAGAIVTAPDESTGQDIERVSGTKPDIEQDSPGKPAAGKMLKLLWLAGLVVLAGHMLYSYIAIKRKLLLSVLYHDEIWLAEDIDIPMVFGLVRPQIYLPIFMEFEDLDYVVAHERMHIHRKDGLFKMLAYVVCLFHWFNPFIWIAYSLFGSDMEKACDEEVIRSMGMEKRKEYAYALLHIAAENVSRKKKVFVAPICFDEGNVKSRIRNIIKYKYTLPGIGATVVIVIIALSVMFLTEAKDSNAEENVITEVAEEESADEKDEVHTGEDVVSGEETELLKTFRVEDLEAVDLRDEFDIEDYYITNKVIVDNRYYIDDDHILWGYGRNEYGQLGIGKADELDIIYTEPIKIAENVVSVDCSVNGYFCIYLTADGQLYGMGSNMLGLLGQEYTEAYTVEQYNKVTTPVLLMENISYARAGREAIVALDGEGSVWWWGQYRATYSTQNNYNAALLYWQATEDESNPMKMFYIRPTKILEHCIYATTGYWSGAAIGQNGELYTWGLNIFGECGTEVTGDDYLRTPTKVLENVRMVWPEKISFDSIEEVLLEIGRYDTTYDFNMFVQLQDGTMMAAGENLGDKEKTIAVTGDLPNPSTHTYSDTFVPIALEEFSEVATRKKLQQLTWGMSMEEAEDILAQGGIQHFRTVLENGDYTVVEDSRYFLDFDEDGHLNRIRLQEGGSRDGRFTLGMPFSDLEKAVEEAGGTLRKVVSDTSYDIWFYQDQEQQIQYEFFVYEGNVTVVHEMMLQGFESVEPTAVNPDELADIFGISISLPENPTWIVHSEYHLLSKDDLKITYHDAITDSDCVLLVARNEKLILPENEYDERLNESWEARTINGRNIVVKVQRGKNESKAVLATWEYNEYQFAIIGEIEGEGDSGPIAKVALHIIHDLN